MNILITQYEKHLEQTYVTPRTISIYLSSLRRFKSWHYEHHGNIAINSEHIELFYQHRLEQVQVGTIKTDRKALLSYFNWAIGVGDIDCSPVPDITLPQTPPTPSPLKEDEQAALITTLNTDIHVSLELEDIPSYESALRHRAMVYLILYAGMTAKDMLRLKRADLSQTIGEGHILINGRRVSLDPKPLNALKDCINLTGETTNLSGWDDVNLHTQQASFTRLLNRLAQEARIPHHRLTVSALRDTFAERMIEQRRDRVDVSNQMGYSVAWFMTRYEPLFPQEPATS